MISWIQTLLSMYRFLQIPGNTKSLSRQSGLFLEIIYTQPCKSSIDNIKSVMSEQFQLRKYIIELCHTGTARNRCSHINEAKCASRKGFSTARATCDFRFCWWPTDTILTKTSALMRHSWTAVGDRLATKIATHKHLC